MTKPKKNILGLTPEEVERELKSLEYSYMMYERTKKETVDYRNQAVDKDGNRKYNDKSTKDTIELMDTMEKDVIDKYIALGGNIENLKSKKIETEDAKSKRHTFDEILKRELAEHNTSTPQYIHNTKNDDITNDTAMNEFVDDADKVSTDENIAIEPYEDTPTDEESTNNNGESLFNIDQTKLKGNTVRYDAIPLPSNGEAYPSKIKTIPVSYLTAYDENLIVSPNLYKNGTFLDYVLKAKIMTNEIDPDDLLPGDRDAIILWLRASGYGSEYPVSVNDDETGKTFDTTIDLSQLKFKKFKLKGDKQGYFDFTLPDSKDKVKFKFLSYKDVKNLERMEESENKKIKKLKINNIIDDINNLINDDKDIERSMKLKLSESIKNMEEYYNNIDEKDDILYTHSVTNRLTASIISINGITDRKYIENYVMYMTVKDSSALRKYITKNEPGIDFNITVERPVSLGGGSMKMFLTLDQFIFLNIA